MFMLLCSKNVNYIHYRPNKKKLTGENVSFHFVEIKMKFYYIFKDEKFI